jgi:hypothetical protein
MSQPALTFFCELPPEPLTTLFDGRFVIDDLKALDATLSLGILDLYEARAAVVKRLNQAGVPVIAWLLLPEEDGYWFNADNHEQAAARYVTFKAWTTQNNLQWAGIGLDIEMDINEMRALVAGEQDQAFARKLWHRLRDKPRVLKAQRSYQALVDLIHADGYPVESYHLPLITEERRAHATVLQRLVGLVDLETDREVLMLYTSFLRPQGAAALWSYASQADSVGVGSTGGGIDLAGTIDAKPLTWEEFARDLRLCVMQEKPIHIFSLEGCVEQGFLSKLNTFDWDQPVAIPEGTSQVGFIRAALAAILWTIERPWTILLAFATLIGLGFLFKRACDRDSEIGNK